MDLKYINDTLKLATVDLPKVHPFSLPFFSQYSRVTFCNKCVLFFIYSHLVNFNFLIVALRLCLYGAANICPSSLIVCLHPKSLGSKNTSELFS